MSARIRLIYEKRNGACFVPHVALATVFTRAAHRAGIKLRMTEGFSPHARMSFGPELPAGVVALAEPVDVWAEDGPGDISEAWNAQMPDGFRVNRCVGVAYDAPALGKACVAAHYLLWPRDRRSAGTFLTHLRSYYGEDVLDASSGDCDKNSRISFVLASPAKNGIGGWVKSAVALELIRGWQDLCIVRTALGRWNGAQLESLAEEGITCLRTEK